MFPDDFSNVVATRQHLPSIQRHDIKVLLVSLYPTPNGKHRSVCTEATNAALTPAAVSRSISETEWTTDARRCSVWTRNIAGNMYADTDRCIRWRCWIHVYGNVSRSIHSFIENRTESAHMGFEVLNAEGSLVLYKKYSIPVNGLIFLASCWLRKTGLHDPSGVYWNIVWSGTL
jgi:hypothetical protein